MLNDFGSYADALDNTKTDPGRKNLNLASDRSNCCPSNVNDIGPRPTNLPVPAATWNCNPYLGNFYNYYGNNSYDTSDVHQYDNRKCGSGVNQFSPRNYTQHAIQSASVLQCCDPRCQLFSDHSKYPFSNTLANKYNNPQRTKPTKNCYDAALEQTTTGSPTTPTTPLKPDKTIDRSKYPSFAYAPMQPNMNKFNGQQPAANYNNLYQNPAKPSKHVLLPSPDSSSFGDYYTDIGKPSYWNKQNSNLWNRGMSNSYYAPPPPPPPPPPPLPSSSSSSSSYDHDKMQQKMVSGVHQHEQNAAAAAAAAAAAQRGILFNRLLDHRSRSMYDAGYLPNYHYGRPPPSPLTPQSHKNPAAAYYQSYQDREIYTDYNGTSAHTARGAPPPHPTASSSLQNSNSYQSLPLYNVHYVDSSGAAAAAAAAAHKDTKDSKAEENKNRLLDKNPNLDVREFLSTWDDVEDDKAPEPETPVIVLDCTSLEAEALAKVKEKLAENIATDCSPVQDTPAAIEFNSHAGNATVLKVIDDQIVSPHTSVIQESVVENSYAAANAASSKKSKMDDHRTPDKAHTESSHNDGYNMWYGGAGVGAGAPASSQHKKKDDLSYDLVEMTERFVNTVDKLFGDEKSNTNEKEAPFYDAHNHHHKEPADKSPEDEWNINFNYKRNKSSTVHGGIAVPEPRYSRPTKDDLIQGCKSYPDEPEKNVSCSFNLQKTSNDLKFSVNYSKQTECYSTRVQDYSVKTCKNPTSNGNSHEKNDRTYKPTCQQQRMEDYTYKNYYNSYYYNNPSYEYMQMHSNVKECAYDVENIDREICNDNASDITLVKADLEKSLKEITHQFSYQKKLENNEKELPKEKTPPPSYDYHRNSHGYLDHVTSSTKNDSLEMPKLDDTNSSTTDSDQAVESSVLATSVIQKTGSCNEKPVYDEITDEYNENSMLSMPSLSPPSTAAAENRSSIGGGVELTLNDVYDDEVIFDTLNKSSHNEDQPPTSDENCLNFLNIVKNDEKRESVVYPLNLALTKDKDHVQSVVKFTNTAVDNQDETNVDTAKESDTVSKVDDGYYSVENHYDKESRNELDGQDLETEIKNPPTQQPTEDTKKSVYKTCIVSREQYEQPAPEQTNHELPRITDDHPVTKSTPDELTESRVSNPSPTLTIVDSNHVSGDDTVSPERDIDTLSDPEIRGKPIDDANKFTNSSTDEEKLLKSSKFKKYKKHKKMKIKELQTMQETGSVIKENGNVTNFKKLFPNIRACESDESRKSRSVDDEGGFSMKMRFIRNKNSTTNEYLAAKSEMNGHAALAGSLPVLVTGDEIDDLENDFNSIKKRKFAGGSFVKDADLPVKKRKQGMAGIEQNFTDGDKNHQTKEMESVSPPTPLPSEVTAAVAVTEMRTEPASEGSNDKYSLNGKYQVDLKNVELADQKITIENEPVVVAKAIAETEASSLATVFDSNNVYRRQKMKKKHKKDKERVKIKSSKKQKKKLEKLLHERRKSSSYNDGTRTLKSPERTMLDDVFNDPYKFRSSGSDQQARSWNHNQAKQTHEHAIQEYNRDTNDKYLHGCDSGDVDEDPSVSQDDEPITGNESMVDDYTNTSAPPDNTTTVEKSPRSTTVSAAEIIPICVNFNDKSTHLTTQINFQEDKHEVGRSREKHNWPKEKHALSDGENYTSRKRKKLKSFHKRALSDDDERRRSCSIVFKPEFIDEKRVNSVISYSSQPPSPESAENEIHAAPETLPSNDCSLPDDLTELNVNDDENPALAEPGSPKGAEIEKSPNPAKQSPSRIANSSPPQSPVESGDVYDRFVASSLEPLHESDAVYDQSVSSPPEPLHESGAIYDQPISSPPQSPNESGAAYNESVSSPPEPLHESGAIYDLPVSSATQSPHESDALYDQSVSSVRSDLSEPTIVVDQESYDIVENQPEISIKDVEPELNIPSSHKSPHISPVHAENEEISTELYENSESHHEIESDTLHDEVPCEELPPPADDRIDDDKISSTCCSAEPSPRPTRCESPKEVNINETAVENHPWSGKNSRRTVNVCETTEENHPWSGENSPRAVNVDETAEKNHAWSCENSSEKVNVDETAEKNHPWSCENSPRKVNVDETIEESHPWSCEISPHRTSFVEEYVPQPVSWSPGPIVGECIVETSHNDDEEEEEEEEEEAAAEEEEEETEHTNWCKNSPFHLDTNIDHEEAISNAPDLDKCDWSNDITPIVSEDEEDTHIPTRVSSSSYEHETTSTNRSPPCSPYRSDIESTKRSTSSSSSSSDSEQSDVEYESRRKRRRSSSKASSTKSSSKASDLDSSDEDERYEKRRPSCRKCNSGDDETKSPSKDDSEDESSICEDEAINKLDDDLFNIPSVAPTPHCDLNKEEDEIDESTDTLKDCGKLSDINSKAPSPNCEIHDEEELSSSFCNILNDNVIVNSHLSTERSYYDSDHSNISSVAPSPKCDIIDGVLLDDTSQISDGFGFEKSFVQSLPITQPMAAMAATTTTTTTTTTIIYEEIPTLRELAANALAKLSIGSVPSFNRSNLLEVWVTPERTEIIIHSEDNEPGQTDLVINDNQVMITDAYGDDEDVNIATNFDQIKEIAFDYSAIDIESSVACSATANEGDKTAADEEVQCQCLIISSEESIVCLRCSLNSSIIVNQDLDIESHHYDVDKPTDNDIVYANEQINYYQDDIRDDLCDPSAFIPVNCIEDSFIDHRITVTPEHTAPATLTIEEAVETEFIPISEAATQTREDEEADIEVENITDSSPPRNPRHVQLKVQLPWHKIFNLNQTNDKHQGDQKILELGPAKIQVRLSPDDPSVLNLVDLKQERVSPVVKVKRLVLQRACDISEKMPSESPKKPNQVSRRSSNPNVDCNKNKIVSRLPKMVIKKTNFKEYKSFLQSNTLQPVVKLYKNKSLDELARKMCKLKNYSINLQQLKSFSFPEDILRSDPVTDQRKDDETLRRVELQANPKCHRDEAVNPAIPDVSSKRDLAPIPESHHCLLCHRSFPSEDSYRIHIKGRFHRHLELTQRKTIHAMYRHFTGHICPRLRPLSAKERKRMKWKPRSANVNHFYHEKTPLQIALHHTISPKNHRHPSSS